MRVHLAEWRPPLPELARARAARRYARRGCQGRGCRGQRRHCVAQEVQHGVRCLLPYYHHGHGIVVEAVGHVLGLRALRVLQRRHSLVLRLADARVYAVVGLGGHHGELHPQVFAQVC